MAIFESAVLTARGNELLIDAVAGNQITFTRMVVGSGQYTDEERARSALEKRTGLKEPQQETTFSHHEKASEQCVRLTAVISNRELTNGYKMTEIGIYGKKTGDAEDYLCSVAVTKSLEETDTFPPYNGLMECQIVQDYYITLSPDAQVTVVTKGASVLMEEFEEFRNSIVTKEAELELNKLDKAGDGSNVTITFSQAGSRQNIRSGSKLSVIMGIIQKVIADLGAAAYAAVANNCTTTAGGSVLDARQGKALKDLVDAAKTEIVAVKQSFQDGVNRIYNALKGLGFTPKTNSPEGIVEAIQKVYDDRYDAGYAEKPDVKSATARIDVTNRGILPRDLSIDTQVDGIFACAVVGMTGILQYSWFENHNHYTLVSVTSSVSGSTLHVHLGGGHDSTTDCDNGDEHDPEVSYIDLKYWYV